MARRLEDKRLVEYQAYPILLQTDTLKKRFVTQARCHQNGGGKAALGSVSLSG
jgi:hypothetical protein